MIEALTHLVGSCGEHHINLQHILILFFIYENIYWLARNI